MTSGEHLRPLTISTNRKDTTRMLVTLTALPLPAVQPKAREGAQGRLIGWADGRAGEFRLDFFRPSHSL